MKEQLHTIPISDAMANAGECPFCYIEQKTEEHMMDFVLGHGASYMEADIRDMTDREGFCRAHFKKMFDYGNSLGNAWILKTLMKRHEEEMDHVWKSFRPDAAAKRSSLFGKKTDGSSNSIVEWINRRESTCFICNSVKNTFQAYMKTFFSMYKKDVDFRAQVANTKGASYMEADIRDMTDREGFCRAHFKKMFDYGNSLGNAWILKTLMKRHEEEMDHVWKSFRPDAAAKRSSLFGKKTDGSSNSIVEWINRRESTCFICNSVKNTFQAYMKTFFSMYKKDVDFRAQVANTKGFCLDHFKVLCEGADEQLSGEEKKEFYATVLPLMKENFHRVYEDVAWFIEKYDYKNKDADWKDSKDAIQRGMQKLRGSDPSLPPHVLKK